MDNYTISKRLDQASDLVKVGNLLEAEEIYRQQFDIIFGQLEEAFLNKADAFRYENDFHQAAEHYRKVLELNPGNTKAYDDLAAVLCNIGNSEHVVVCYNKLIEIRPDNPYNYNNLGIFYYNNKIFEEAIKYYKKAIELKPDYPDPYNNVAIAFHNQDNIEKSIEHYKKAIELNPNYADAHNNLGTSYLDARKLNEALNHYQKAAELRPDYADAHFGMGYVYLLTQNFEKGWEYYEWRLKNKSCRILPILETRPRWNGEKLEDKILYVYPEQGFGDVMLFARYLPLLNRLGVKTIFKPFVELETLFKESDLGVEIIDPRIPDESVEFDAYVTIASLPYILKTDLETMPFASGYLKANESKTAFYKENYFNNDKFKLGIVWQGNREYANDRNRSLPLSSFYRFAKLPNVKLYSLQKDHYGQLNNLPNGLEITDLGSTFNDFSDTAAAIENLDLLITIDTSVAHLSGALGKPTWILTSFVSDWRWFTDIDNSPWYESVKLFRQKKLGKWKGALNKAFESLKDLLSN